MKISVLGAGGWGTTLGILLNENKHQVTLWEYEEEYAEYLIANRINKKYLPGINIPNEIEITHDLESAAENREIIVLAVPTQFLRGAIKNLSKKNIGGAILVSVSKGIEKKSLLTMSQMLKEEF